MDKLFLRLPSGIVLNPKDVSNIIPSELEYKTIKDKFIITFYKDKTTLSSLMVDREDYEYLISEITYTSLPI